MMNGAYGAYSGGLAGCGAAGGIFGFHFSTLLLAGLGIFALYVIFKKRKHAQKKEPIFISEKPSIDAAEIVRLRYARGEISFDEFQNILKNIQS